MDPIQRCLAGDQEAFAEIYDRYKNLVYRTAYLMVDNEEDAEDVLQEVFMQVYRSLATFGPAEGAFTTWLHRVTVNCCLHRHRKRQFALLPLDTLPPSLLSHNISAIEEQLGVSTAIRQTLNGLSKKSRAILVLRYYLELSYAEIAQILNIPLGTVKSRLNQARRLFRQALAEAMEDAPAPALLRRRRCRYEVPRGE